MNCIANVIITSNFFSRSRSCWSCTLCVSSKILVSLDAWTSSEWKKPEVILEMDRDASTALRCPCAQQQKLEQKMWLRRTANDSKFRYRPPSAYLQNGLVFLLVSLGCTGSHLTSYLLPKQFLQNTVNRKNHKKCCKIYCIHVGPNKMSLLFLGLMCVIVLVNLVSRMLSENSCRFLQLNHPKQ